MCLPAVDVGGWRHDGGVEAWPSTTFKAADGWDHNCVFDIATTLAASPDGTVPDATWVTGGDEYGSCHGSPAWCGLHSWIGVSRDGGRTFTDTTWDSTYRINQVRSLKSLSTPPAQESLPRVLFLACSGESLPCRRPPIRRNEGRRRSSHGPPSDIHARRGPDVGQRERRRGVCGAARQLLVWTAPRSRPAGDLSSLPVSGVLVQNVYPRLCHCSENAQINASSPEATVYYYNGTTTLFTSRDSGATFAITNTGLNPWNTPFFGVAVPPRGAAAAGDLWVFSGWQLFHR